MNNPKEWLIPWYWGGTKQEPVKVHTHCLCKNGCDFHQDHTHVIEKSAYDDLERRYGHLMEVKELARKELGVALEEIERLKDERDDAAHEAKNRDERRD